MDRINSKDYRKGTYEIKKLSLSCFDDKIYIQNNGYINIYLNNYLKKLFCQPYCFHFQPNQDSFLVKHFARLLAWHIKFEKHKALKKR